jgi:hypothetical protein
MAEFKTEARANIFPLLTVNDTDDWARIPLRILPNNQNVTWTNAVRKFSANLIPTGTAPRLFYAT